MSDQEDDIIFEPQEGPQLQFATSMADIALYGGAAGGGKALLYGTPVLTERGFKPIEKLKPGQYVMNPDGLPSKVMAVFDHEEKDMYEITFTDDTSIIACDEHQWTSWQNYKTLKRKSLSRNCDLPEDPYALYPRHAQVVDTLQLKKWNDNGFCPQIPVTRPLYQNTTYKEKESRIIYGISNILLRSSLNPNKLYTVINTLPMGLDMSGPDFYRYLESIGIAGKELHNRRIPEDILRGSVESRKLFLQGMMDQAGIPDTGGTVIISVPMQGPLFDDICYLARSLGVEAHYISQGKKLKLRFSPFVDPFLYNEAKISKFKRPLEPLSKGIKSVEYWGKGPARCITVDNPNSLYITKDFIVTHNTFGLLLEPLKWLDIDNFHTLIFRRAGTEITQAGGLWDESCNIYPEFGGIPTPSKKLWTFPNGNKVQMLDLEHESTLEKRKGSQSPLIMFDELTTFTERMFFYMMSRNRSATKVPAYFRATTNPMPSSDPTGGWVRGFISWWLDESGFPIPERSGVIRWFWRYQNEIHWANTREELVEKFGPKYGYDIVLPKSFTFIPAKVDDNKLIDPTYKSNLLAQGRADKEMLLDGCWDVKIDSGTYFQRDWCELVHKIEEPMELVRYWDRAATEPNEAYPDPDWTAGVLVGMGKKSKTFYVLDCVRFRKGPYEVKTKIRETAIKDQQIYGSVKIGIERDPGAAGKSEAQDLRRFLGGFNVVTRTTQNKDKLTRFKPFSSAAEAGDVKILSGKWNKDYFNELESFIGDGKTKDDQADATSGAYSEFITSAFRMGNIALPDLSTTSIIKGLS